MYNKSEFKIIDVDVSEELELTEKILAVKSNDSQKDIVFADDIKNDAYKSANHDGLEEDNPFIIEDEPFEKNYDAQSLKTNIHSPVQTNINNENFRNIVFDEVLKNLIALLIPLVLGLIFYFAISFKAFAIFSIVWLILKPIIIILQKKCDFINEKFQVTVWYKNINAKNAKFGIFLLLILSIAFQFGVMYGANYLAEEILPTYAWVDDVLMHFVVILPFVMPLYKNLVYIISNIPSLIVWKEEDLHKAANLIGGIQRFFKKTNVFLISILCIGMIACGIFQSIEILSLSHLYKNSFKINYTEIWRDIKSDKNFYKDDILYANCKKQDIKNLKSKKTRPNFSRFNSVCRTKMKIKKKIKGKKKTFYVHSYHEVNPKTKKWYLVYSCLSEN